MGNYISRDEFAKYLADIQYGEAPTGENIDYQNGVYAGLDMAYVALERFPAADVRPVVYGSWIVTDYGDYQLIECDQCHAQMWNHQSELPNYCHECGADMRPERGTKE